MNLRTDEPTTSSSTSHSSARRQSKRLNKNHEDNRTSTATSIVPFDAPVGNIKSNSKSAENEVCGPPRGFEQKKFAPAHELLGTTVPLGVHTRGGRASAPQSSMVISGTTRTPCTAVDHLCTALGIHGTYLRRAVSKHLYSSIPRHHT